MFEKSFELQGVKATVHPEDGKAVLFKRWILPHFVNDSAFEFELSYQFVRVLTQSTDVTVPFAWPEPSAVADEFRAARDAWFALPGAVVRKWLDILTEVDTPPGDVDLLPPDQLDEKKEQTPPSPENELNSEESLTAIS